jgi:flagellar basal-body rod modification protein FlgD
MATTPTAATQNPASTNPAQKAASGVASSRTQIASNFNQFLLLLTTQLKNQNPLDPLDTNQFTQQLVQFAGVEQQLQTNDTLSSLLKTTQTANASNAYGYVGAEITADGATTHLSPDTGASWHLTAPRAGIATITISDKDGNVVATDSKALQAGAQDYAWDGRTSTGLKASEGDYTITVTASDATGKQMNISTEMTGIVDSVDLSGGTPILRVGAISIPVTNVKSIRKSS